MRRSKKNCPRGGGGVQGRTVIVYRVWGGVESIFSVDLQYELNKI